MRGLLRGAAGAFLSLALVACGSGEPPVGKWVVDVDKTMEPILEQTKAMVEQMKKLADAFPGAAGQPAADPKAKFDAQMEEVRKKMRSVVIEFASDGTVKSEGSFDGRPGDRLAGTWKRNGSVVQVEAGKDSATLEIRGEALVMTMPMDGAPTKQEVWLKRK